MRGTTWPKYDGVAGAQDGLAGRGHVEQGDPAARAQDPGQLGEERPASSTKLRRAKPLTAPSTDAVGERAGAGRRPGPAGASVRAWASIPADRSTPTAVVAGRGQVAAQVAGPAGQVEDPVRRAAGPARATAVRPPAPVQPEGHDPVDQVVAGGDGVEHGPHGADLVVPLGSSVARLPSRRSARRRPDRLRRSNGRGSRPRRPAWSPPSISKVTSRVTWTPPATSSTSASSTPSADLGADRHRRREAQLVEPVVDCPWRCPSTCEDLVEQAGASDRVR